VNTTVVAIYELGQDPAVCHPCPHLCKIIFAYQFNNEPSRILLAALVSGDRQLDAFVVSTFQKVMLHEVQLSDLAFSHPEQTKWNSQKSRFFSSAAAAKNEYDDEGEGEDDTSVDLNPVQVNAPGLPMKPSPLLVAMYRQSCTSYQSAARVFYARQLFPSLTGRTRRLIITGVRKLPQGSICPYVSGNRFATSCDADNRHHMIA